jgi:hypothetical protein
MRITRWPSSGHDATPASGNIEHHVNGRNRDLMAPLRDQELTEYRTAAVDERPVAAGTRWLVLLKEGQPIGALSPGSVLDNAAPPAIIVAPAGLDLDTALASDAFADAPDVNAVVLVEEGGVAGVWSGQSLAMAVLRGPSRSTGAPVLPGPPQIPLIVRSCAFRELGASCATVSSFASKPFPMPACRNDRHLSAHDFAW